MPQGRITQLKRPYPPIELADSLRFPEGFLPAPEVTAWIREMFLTQGSWLWNEEHAHLTMAVIDVLWTNTVNTRQQRTALATAEIPEPRGTPWVKRRQEFQLEQWFGRIPDFLLTFDAVLTPVLNDASWCALVEHELYHCAQAKDEYGSPRWHRDGTPFFAMRGHDVEEFVGVVRRYGAGASRVTDLVDAAKAPPLIAGAAIAEACGTCAAKAA